MFPIQVDDKKEDEKKKDDADKAKDKKASEDKDKKEEDKKTDDKDKKEEEKGGKKEVKVEREPLFDTLSNPARVMKPQLKLVSLEKEAAAKYKPTKDITIGGKPRNTFPLMLNSFNVAYLSPCRHRPDAEHERPAVRHRGARGHQEVVRQRGHRGRARAASALRVHRGLKIKGNRLMIKSGF